MHRIYLTLLIAMFSCSTYSAGEKTNNTEAKQAAPVEEQTVTTRHQARIGGRNIPYEATAGTIILPNKKDQQGASMFYMAYVRTDDQGDGRPISFVFNGGPGSSSVWLHIGAFGPRRVQFEDQVAPQPAPYEIVDNHASLLDISDLVFIDPVATGYSKTLGETEDNEYLGVEEDIRAVGEFIRLYITRQQRWNSPKFLAGESYGTTRAAGLVNYLQGKGIFFNGVALVSSILNFQASRFETGNDLPYITLLPTMTAIAWYHKVLPGEQRSLEEQVDEARRFASGDYAGALMQGDKLSDAERRRIVQRLHQLTGLEPDFIEHSNLRISTSRFSKSLLRDRRRTVGRLDGRYLGIDQDTAGEDFEHDPSYTAILGPFTAALNDYVRTELKFEEDREYEILSYKVNRSWNWTVKGRTGYVNVAADLSEAISKNPHLKVFVANGYYDLATAFFATEYTMDHLGLDASLRDNISMAYYPAGHMMYIHPPSLDQLKQDMADFIAAALSARQ